MSAINLDELVARQKAYEAKVDACPHDFTGRSMYGDGPTCTKCGVLELAWLRREAGRLRHVLEWYATGHGAHPDGHCGDYGERAREALAVQSRSHASHGAHEGDEDARPE